MSELYPQVSVDEWCLTYDLKQRTEKCLKCGREQTTTLPWAAGEWRGLVAPVHECGEEYRLTTAVSVAPGERDQWKELFNLCKEKLT